MWEWFGIVFLSNITDGLRMITIGRVNDAAADSGDATITIDLDMAGRLTAFDAVTTIASSSLRIKGTDEAMTSLVVATGVVTLDGTLSQSYSDNDICIVVSDISSGREKALKGTMWKNRMHLWGFPSASNVDAPNNTISAGQFVIGQTGATGIEKIVDFTYGTGGSTLITANGGGKVTNILEEKEFIYVFTQNKVFGAASSDVTISGSAIGATTLDVKDTLHGCLNESSATSMGGNALTYITSDNRIMRIPIDSYTGAVASKPEEDFDRDVRQHLKDMSSDQTGALCYHFKGGRMTIYQIKISGQWKWLIFDQNIIQNIGGNLIKGAWQPPQNINPVTDFFERDGTLYGTDASTNNVYSFFTVFTDNLNAIQAKLATGELDLQQAMLQKCKMWGSLNQASDINITFYVFNNMGGKRSGSVKHILGSDFSYAEEAGVGATPVGGGGAVAQTTQTARWRKDFDIFPSEATRAQLVAEEFKDGGYFSVDGYELTGQQFSDSFSSSI